MIAAPRRVMLVAPPSLSDVSDQLSTVNDTLDKVSETLDTINSTAYGLIDTFLSSTDALVEILNTVQKAAVVASKFPGGDKITEEATTLIDLVNSSILKTQDDSTEILAKIETQIG